MLRRDLLKLLAAGSIGSLIPSSSRAQQPARQQTAPPRYYVFIFLQGGIDAVWSTDPRTRAEVESGVDVPYKPEAIKRFGNHAVGPHLALLGDAVKDLTIINGVHTHVLNHISGFRQFLRLKIGADGRMPTFMNILGGQRDTQAAGEMYVDARGSVNGLFAPGFLGSSIGEGKNFYDLLESTAPDDLRRLARVFRGQRDRLTHADRVSPDEVTTAANIEETARLFERAADVAPLKVEDWRVQPKKPRKKNPEAAKKNNVATRLQRVLWLIENDLSRCVFAEHSFWDTHSLNTKFQSEQANDLYPALAKFFAGLRTRSNRYGTLADNTVVFIGSELGRFPRLNVYDGKDHFPEAPVMLFGKGLQKGVFGATGKSMEALPISLRTGKQQSGGTKISLDDISATLLFQAGIDPLSYGYFGQKLEFMLA